MARNKAAQEPAPARVVTAACDRLPEFMTNCHVHAGLFIRSSAQPRAAAIRLEPKTTIKTGRTVA